MSLISNVKVYGLEESVRRAKFPFAIDATTCTEELTTGIQGLARSKTGAGHDQFLTGIVVQFDLSCTIKMWTEAERYHFFDFVSSQSTMHKICKFNLDKAYIDYVDPEIIGIMKDKVAMYNELCEASTYWADDTSDAKKEYDETIKKLYLEILYSNPCGMILTAGMTTNYRQLKTIYYQRKDHRLPEWREFCKWIESLPMFKELILGEKV